MGRFLRGLGLALVMAGFLLPAVSAQEARGERLVSFLDETPLEGSSLPGGARVVEAFPFAGVALVEAPLSAFPRLAAAPGVAGVYADEPLTFALDRSRAGVRADAPAGDASWPRGAGVTIAVVDSGIDASHPGFAGRILESVRVARGGVHAATGDDDGHGTHIAGILAGDGAASRGGRLHGLAPEADLVALDISDAFTTTTAIRAFEWIHEHRHEHGIRVVSNSWGREKPDAHYDPHDPVIRASDALVADGLVVVFSAGNRGRDGGATLTTEATNPNVVSVGSASLGGRPEPYSSRGPARDASGQELDWVKPDLVAPGTAILSARTSAHAPAQPRDAEERHYTVMNGTSMAAPHVAAAAALLLQADPSLRPEEVATVLRASARDLGAAGPDPDTGHGMLDVQAALEAARSLRASQRTVLVERAVPVHAEGSLTGVAGRVVLVGDEAALPPQDAVVLPLAFPEGAARVTLHLNWTGPGALTAALRTPEGREVPFARAHASGLALHASVEPGAHRIVVRPEGPAASSPFVVEGALIVVESHVVETPAELHARGYGAKGGFFETRSGARALVDLPSSVPAIALVASVGAIAVCGAWLRWRRA